jgi:hypothetical protein
MNSNSERAARGSLYGRWTPWDDRQPNLRGAIVIERPLKPGDRLWLSAWTTTVGPVEFISISAAPAAGGPRRRAPGPLDQDEAEPEGQISRFAAKACAGNLMCIFGHFGALGR